MKGLFLRRFVLRVALVCAWGIARLRRAFWMWLVGNDDARPILVRRTLLDFGDTAGTKDDMTRSETAFPASSIAGAAWRWVGFDALRRRLLARRIAPLRYPFAQSGRLVEVREYSWRGSVLGRVAVVDRDLQHRREARGVDGEDDEDAVHLAGVHSCVTCPSVVGQSKCPKLTAFANRFVATSGATTEGGGPSRRALPRDAGLAVAYVLGYVDDHVVCSLLAHPERDDRLEIVQVAASAFSEERIASNGSFV